MCEDAKCRAMQQRRKCKKIWGKVRGVPTMFNDARGDGYPTQWWWKWAWTSSLFLGILGVLKSRWMNFKKDVEAGKRRRSVKGPRSRVRHRLKRDYVWLELELISFQNLSPSSAPPQHRQPYFGGRMSFAAGEIPLFYTDDWQEIWQVDASSMARKTILPHAIGPFTVRSVSASILPLSSPEIILEFIHCVRWLPNAIAQITGLENDTLGRTSHFESIAYHRLFTWHVSYWEH